jgi:hypothetical protein
MFWGRSEVLALLEAMGKLLNACISPRHVLLSSTLATTIGIVSLGCHHETDGLNLIRCANPDTR